MGICFLDMYVLYDLRLFYNFAPRSPFRSTRLPFYSFIFRTFTHNNHRRTAPLQPLFTCSFEEVPIVVEFTETEDQIDVVWLVIKTSFGQVWFECFEGILQSENWKWDLVPGGGGKKGFSG